MSDDDRRDDTNDLRRASERLQVDAIALQVRLAAELARAQALEQAPAAVLNQSRLLRQEAQPLIDFLHLQRHRRDRQRNGLG